MIVYDKTPIQLGLNLFGAIPNACQKRADNAVGSTGYTEKGRDHLCALLRPLCIDQQQCYPDTQNTSASARS